MFSSSPVSVEIFPSCRTLVVGSLHRGRVDNDKLQFPFSEDPFTDMIGLPPGYKYNLGNTSIIIRYSHARELANIYYS